MPSSTQADTQPPKRAIAEVHNTSSGIARESATTLGSTRRRLRETPIAASASISSVTRITPSCAVIAEPERPATSTDTSTGPSSRMMPMPRMLTMKASAPKVRSCSADR
ncbi:MAG: hypothetical protein BWZ09_01499 [Alphaproteobacteria bacterium ADurb.BinA305]|nr:MAG: hypothetical protein BWZ09_01499 [Alphaproteobacteria bacterium ADurb.BinA305]